MYESKLFDSKDLKELDIYEKNMWRIIMIDEFKDAKEKTLKEIVEMNRD